MSTSAIVPDATQRPAVFYTLHCNAMYPVKGDAFDLRIGRGTAKFLLTEMESRVVRASGSIFTSDLDFYKICQDASEADDETIDGIVQKAAECFTWSHPDADASAKTLKESIASAREARDSQVLREEFTVWLAFDRRAEKEMTIQASPTD